MAIVTKEEFIKLVIEQFVSSLSMRDAEIIVGGVMRALIESLKKGKVRIYGFGSFQGVIKPARNGRNPHTGESIKIPERIAVKFIPSPNLKETIEPFIMKKTKEVVKKREKKISLTKKSKV